MLLHTKTWDASHIFRLQICSVRTCTIAAPYINIQKIHIEISEIHKHTVPCPSSSQLSLTLLLSFIASPKLTLKAMDPTYPLVPIANFIGCVLSLIPLLHMDTRFWNTGVYVFVLWSFLSCFPVAINTVVWSNDVKDRAPVWCDICK